MTHVGRSAPVTCSVDADGYRFSSKGLEFWITSRGVPKSDYFDSLVFFVEAINNA